MLIKYLQYYGGGIVVGYFGNPKINTTFDSSLSPSAVISMSYLSLWNQNFRELMEKYKINLQFAYIQSFTEPSNISIPLEYVVTPVDERIALYENFNESNYHVFVEKAKEIFAKYQKNVVKLTKILFYIIVIVHFKNKICMEVIHVEMMENGILQHVFLLIVTTTIFSIKKMKNVCLIIVL